MGVTSNLSTRSAPLFQLLPSEVVHGDGRRTRTATQRPAIASRQGDRRDPVHEIKSILRFYLIPTRGKHYGLQIESELRSIFPPELSAREVSQCLRESLRERRSVLVVLHLFWSGDVFRREPLCVRGSSSSSASLDVLLISASYFLLNRPSCSEASDCPTSTADLTGRRQDITAVLPCCLLLIDLKSFGRAGLAKVSRIPSYTIQPLISRWRWF